MPAISLSRKFYRFVSHTTVIINQLMSSGSHASASTTLRVLRWLTRIVLVSILRHRARRLRLGFGICHRDARCLRRRPHWRRVRGHGVLRRRGSYSRCARDVVADIKRRSERETWRRYYPLRSRCEKLTKR